MKLYSYWRSTTSYRVRAALNLKGVPYETVTVDLDARDQVAPEYIALNPAAAVPVVVLEDGAVLTQSMAILDYIEAKWPEPRLLPEDPLERARVLAVAHSVSMDIHAVNNLRVVQALASGFEASPDQQKTWMQKWMLQGFTAIEPHIAAKSAFAFGDVPTLADLCIVSQMYNAHRWEVPLAPFPKLIRVAANCLALPAIAAAHPNNQPDAKDIR